MPSTIRPPETRCNEARADAVTAMLRTRGLVTQVPSRILAVCWAIRVNCTYASCHSTWESKTQP